MENQKKDAKRQLLKDELTVNEFNERMKNRVIEELHSTTKAPKIKPNSKRVIPVIISVSLIALSFAGIYAFVLNNNSGASSSNSKVTVEDDQNKESKNPQVADQPGKEETEAIHSDSNNKQKDEPNAATGTAYFDEEFAQLARKGFIKGLPLGVGTTVGKIIERYGEPLQYGAGEGAYGLAYDGFSFYYPAVESYEDRANVTVEETTIGAALQLKETLYLSDMKKGLGTPVSAGVSDMDGSFMIEYQFGNYHLWAQTESDEKSPLLYVELIKKE